ncbi:hypothetical protein GOODEAATRI_003669 [Goodea atripinnis]|uniref:Fibronectin type-III domain-containing protein n=1 Tax=Goodea atripinnis TaxID=208336 RepID=A0ABV0PV25_9TELE
MIIPEPGRAPTRIRGKSLSASEIEVSWKALPWNASKRRVLGYEGGNRKLLGRTHRLPLCFAAFQLRYWSRSEKEETASVQRTTGNQTSTVIGGLRGSTAYYISVRAYNTAGTGPASTTVNMTTKKPRNRPSVMETNTTSVELALPTDEDYIIQIKPFGEGGDGSSSKQITIPKIPAFIICRGSQGPNAVGSASKVSTLSALSTIALSFTARTSL